MHNLILCGDNDGARRHTKNSECIKKKGGSTDDLRGDKILERIVTWANHLGWAGGNVGGLWPTPKLLHTTKSANIRWYYVFWTRTWNMLGPKERSIINITWVVWGGTVEVITRSFLDDLDVQSPPRPGGPRRWKFERSSDLRLSERWLHIRWESPARWSAPPWPNVPFPLIASGHSYITCILERKS